MKKCSTLYVTGQLQIKRTMIYHYTTIRMANPKHWQQQTPMRTWNNRNSHSLLIGMENGRHFGKFLTKPKAKHTFTIWSHTCRNECTNELENDIHTKTCTQMFIPTLFIVSKTWKQPRCPSVGEWISKLWCSQTVVCYSVLKEIRYQAKKIHGGNLNAYY